jgi:murein DD-endopeptidase MepM/ murein hydrolase activator NlpD
MKKSFFSKLDPNSRGKFIQFLDKKGFYIVLFMCVLIIGVTAVLVTRTNLDFYARDGIVDDEPAVEESPGEEASKQADVPVAANVDPKDTARQAVDENGVKKSEGTNKEISSAKTPIIVQQPVTKKEDAKPSEPQTDKTAEKPKTITRLMPPVSGEIILDYAMEKLVYSKTLEEWRTHSGIDIRSDRGTQVKAAADGMVEKIYKDNGLGITIIINHGNGLKTKYCNLSSDNMVKENQKVKQGEVISGVGDTAIFEIGDQPHLHFEVIKDGKNVDPKTYLPN